MQEAWACMHTSRAAIGRCRNTCALSLANVKSSPYAGRVLSKALARAKELLRGRSTVVRRAQLWLSKLWLATR